MKNNRIHPSGTKIQQRATASPVGASEESAAEGREAANNRNKFCRRPAF